VLAAAVAYYALFFLALYLSGRDGRSGMPAGQFPIQPIMYGALVIGVLSAGWILIREFGCHTGVGRRGWAGIAVSVGLILTHGPYLYDWYVDSSNALLGVYPLGLGTVMLIVGWSRYCLSAR
jgi:hypothetical protein